MGFNSRTIVSFARTSFFVEMAPAMKAPVKAMSKGALADALATQCELKKTVCSKVLDTLAGVATKEVKKTEVFGKLVMVKAKPARKIVKAFPVAALKASI